MHYLTTIKTKIRHFFGFKNWEYWPSYMFYVPLLPYAFYLALKSKSIGFFEAANPGIEFSGNGLESKFKTIKLFPDDYKPVSVLINKNETEKNCLLKIQQHNIQYPFIIKPDIGFRGLLVKKINNIDELKSYLTNYNSINLIVQEFISYENECGIFFYKIPGEKTGIVSSLTLKEYPKIIGDGNSTVEILINKNKRFSNYLSLIIELNKNKLNYIPKKNEVIILNCIGNHAKGTQFLNGNHLINKDLNLLMNKLNKHITGWNYGRIDVKFKSFDELLKGKNFKIIELNGIIAEPTHIYDSRQGSYFKALASIITHWKIIQKISIENKLLNQVKFSNLSTVLGYFSTYRSYIKKIKKLDTT